VEQIRDLQIMMFTYSNVVYKRYVDNICLTARRYFLEFVKKDLRSGLLRIVRKDFDFLSLFKESASQEQKRVTLVHSIANLELAKKQLAGI
jgi:hypothetical protein